MKSRVLNWSTGVLEWVGWTPILHYSDLAPLRFIERPT
jgi:hypothetical protein